MLHTNIIKQFMLGATTKKIPSASHRPMDSALNRFIFNVFSNTKRLSIWPLTSRSACVRSEIERFIATFYPLYFSFTLIPSSGLIYFYNVFLKLNIICCTFFFITRMLIVLSLSSLLSVLFFISTQTELCDAATRIQAAFRGHLARKLAGDDGAELKDDKDLQEITKKVAEELDIDMNDPELHRAATKIQASFRGHKARKDTTA